MTFPAGPERPQDQRPRLAGWWTRVGAVLVDTLILLAITCFALIAAVIVAAPFGGSGDISGPLWLLFTLVLCSAYFVVLMKRAGAQNGQTLGKQAVGIKVIRDDGAPVTTKTVLIREVVLKFIVGTVTFGLGVLIDMLWPLVDRENRALHDMVVKTHVVEVHAPAVDTRPRPRPAQSQPALAPQIARQLDAARATEARIREAVDRAALPYTEVCTEVDSLVRAMDESARARAAAPRGAGRDPGRQGRAAAARARGLGQDVADRRAQPAARGAAPDAVPARPLRRRDGARRRRAGHRARQPAQRLGLHGRRQPGAHGRRGPRAARRDRRRRRGHERGVRPQLARARPVLEFGLEASKLSRVRARTIVTRR